MEENKVYFVVAQQEPSKIETIARKVYAGALIGTVVVALTPIVVNVVGNVVETIKFKRKIRKGLKDGSIVEVNGEYYEVNKEIVEEEPESNN